MLLVSVYTHSIVCFVSDRKLWISILAVVVAGGGWALTNVPVYSDMNEVTK